MGVSRGRITMTEVRVHAAFSVEDEDLFLSEAKKMILATQKEKGCIHYQLYKEQGKDKSYAMIETWETSESLVWALRRVGRNPTEPEMLDFLNNVDDGNGN